MPKRVFWPIALIVMGLIFLASRMQLLPGEFANLWPIMLIIIGLGGLLTSDRDEWLTGEKTQRSATVKPAARVKSAARTTPAPARKPSRAVSRKKR